MFDTDKKPGVEKAHFSLLTGLELLLKMIPVAGVAPSVCHFITSTTVDAIIARIEMTIKRGKYGILAFYQ